MSVARKNARRLRLWRSRGVPIDGSYRIPALWLARQDAREALLRLVYARDEMRDMVKIHPSDLHKAPIVRLPEGQLS